MSVDRVQKIDVVGRDDDGAVEMQRFLVGIAAALMMTDGDE